MSYETLLYGVEAGVATITLNRPEQLNTIVPPMPDEVEAAVEAATRDGEVRVIVLLVREEGARAGIEHRDGPYGDYNQAPPERRPNPDNVIDPGS
jgi:enoyl-CoA hydratase